MSKEDIIVTVEHQLSVDDLNNIAITAIEGGSNYWALVEAVDRNEGEIEFFAEEVVHGKGLWVYDTELVEDEDDLTEENKLGLFDYEALVRGIQLLNERGWQEVMERIVDEQYDADDTDTVMQLGVLGDVVYG